MFKRGIPVILLKKITLEEMVVELDDQLTGRNVKQPRDPENFDAMISYRSHLWYSWVREACPTDERACDFIIRGVYKVELCDLIGESILRFINSRVIENVLLIRKRNIIDSKDFQDPKKNCKTQRSSQDLKKSIMTLIYNK